MARIRTVKPEFWTDQKTGTLSDTAKVLFLGLLNHADDCGVLRFSADELRVKIFPYDSRPTTVVVTAPLLDELLPKGLVELFGYSAADNGPLQQFLFIVNFSKHQVINKRSQPLLHGFLPNDSPVSFAERTGAVFEKATIGLPLDSGSPPALLPGGREGKGREGSTTTPPSPSKTGEGAGGKRERVDSAAACEDVVQLWNRFAKWAKASEALPFAKSSKPRQDALKRALRDGADFKKAIVIASKSDFILREIKEKHWFSFDWLLRPANFQKLIEGKYGGLPGVPLDPHAIREGPAPRGLKELHHSGYSGIRGERLENGQKPAKNGDAAVRPGSGAGRAGGDPAEPEEPAPAGGIPDPG